MAMNLLDVIIDWSRLVDYGTDAAAYFVMGAAATLLFLIRLVLASLSGGDAEFDTDMDAGVDSDASFTFFSLLSILAFFMGAGWMGLACRVDFHLGSFVAALSATAFGLAMMLLASGLAYTTRKLNSQIEYDMTTALGRTGRVYLTIPEKGHGQGQVEVTISGRRMVKPAVSTGPKIDAFTDVTILNVQDDETLVVEPKP